MTTTRHLQKLADLAASLRPRFTPEKLLPRLLFVTDPVRTPDPEAITACLPAGSGVIYRAFGAADAVERGLRLRRIATERGVVLLVGADEGLADACAADGLHIPQGLTDKARRLLDDRPDWILTAAAHSPDAAIAAADAGCHAVLASVVFASNSPSAGAPMGADAFAAFVAAAPLPVYALGGVTLRTAPDLVRSGAQGFAMVEGLVDAVRI